MDTFLTLVPAGVPDSYTKYAGWYADHFKSSLSVRLQWKETLKATLFLIYLIRKMWIRYNFLHHKMKKPYFLLEGKVYLN